MTRFLRSSILPWAWLGAVLCFATPWQAAEAYMTPAERQSLVLNDYKVTNKDESYFDVAERMALLRRTDDPHLKQLKQRLGMGLSCSDMKAQPVLDGEVTLPSFYNNPGAWRITAEPLLAFEERMSNLAGAWVSTGDAYFANCLVDILDEWAKANALYEFSFTTLRPQAWYSIESMIFAAALAYSTVTGEIKIPPQKRQRIEKWFSRIARRHFETKGPLPSCCNNHYYRRSLYMTIVGVVTGDDKMFQTGLRSVYSALDDLKQNGAFGFAMRRGWRAIHYQNYSLLYLVATMQVAYRQGYDLFTLDMNGRGFQDAVRFLLSSLEGPYAIEGPPPGEQDLTFTNDEQYFSWMEIWLSHYDNPAMERFVRLYRPVFNRGAGGHLTLYFKRPEDPKTVLERQRVNLRSHRMSPAEIGARYPYLEKWRRSQ